MSKIYQYTGTHYTNFEGSGFSSANRITVTIKTPTTLPAGLEFGDALPGRIDIDNPRRSTGLQGPCPRAVPPTPPWPDGNVTLSVQLSLPTRPGGLLLGKFHWTMRATWREYRIQQLTELPPLSWHPIIH